MKKLIFLLGLGLIIGMSNINTTEAQVHVSINIDIQPAWGPSGYDYVEYYYIPEINVYYNVVNQRFYHYSGRRWVASLFLPIAFSHYDFYSLYKVVLNGVYNPWRYNSRHVGLYRSYYYNYSQMPIFYMNDYRYQRARNNYHNWVEPRYMPRDNGRPNSRNYSMNTRSGRIDNSPAPGNRRDNVNSRNNNNLRGNNNNGYTRNNPSVGARSDNRNNQSTFRNNNSSGNTRNNASVTPRINNRNNNSSLRNNNSSGNTKSNSSVNTPRSNRNNDTSASNSKNNNSKRNASISSRNSNSSNESKSSRSTSERSSDRQGGSRSARK